MVRYAFGIQKPQSAGQPTRDVCCQCPAPVRVISTLYPSPTGHVGAGVIGLMVSAIRRIVARALTWRKPGAARFPERANYFRRTPCAVNVSAVGIG